MTFTYTNVQELNLWHWDVPSHERERLDITLSTDRWAKVLVPYLHVFRNVMGRFSRPFKSPDEVKEKRSGHSALCPRYIWNSVAVATPGIWTPAGLAGSRCWASLTPLCHTEAACLPGSEEGTKAQKMCMWLEKRRMVPLLWKAAYQASLTQSAGNFLASFFLED